MELNNNQKLETPEINNTIFPTFVEVKYYWQEFKKRGYSNSNLYIKNAGNKGLGVFSKTDIKQGQVIEYCHSILLETPRQWMRDAGISKYSYWTGGKNQQGIIPLGFGAIYNSAERDFLRNADFFIFPEDNLIVFVAQEDIPAGKEILLWWGEAYYGTWCLPRNGSDSNN